MKRSNFKPKPPKPKRCKHCRIKPVLRPGAIACGPECAMALGDEAKAKKARIAAKRERLDDIARRDNLRSNEDEADLTQSVVNGYVNVRDAGKPCISCDKPDVGVRNASHFKSRGSNSALRFNLWNIHSACYSCNMKKGGNIHGYRPRLEAKIGADKVEWLDNHPRSREYSKEYLRRMRAIFAKKTRRLQRRQSPDNYTEY